MRFAETNVSFTGKTKRVEVEVKENGLKSIEVVHELVEIGPQELKKVLVTYMLCLALVYFSGPWGNSFKLWQNFNILSI